jgi:hypothetical protein
MAAAGLSLTTWFDWISSMQERGRFGWISRFCGKPRALFYSAQVPTDALLVSLVPEEEAKWQRK